MTKHDCKIAGYDDKIKKWKKWIDDDIIGDFNDRCQFVTESFMRITFKNDFITLLTRTQMLFYKVQQKPLIWPYTLVYAQTFILA